MAMHVPKGPGFAQMLKDGAKVGINNDIMWYTNRWLSVCRETFVIQADILHVCVLDGHDTLVVMTKRPTKWNVLTTNWKVEKPGSIKNIHLYIFRNLNFVFAVSILTTVVYCQHL